MTRAIFHLGGSLPGYLLAAFMRLLPNQAIKPLDWTVVPAIDLAAPFGLSWPVVDQGRAATCVAHTVCACIELAEATAELRANPTPTPSPPKRLSARFLYAASRKYKSAFDDKGWLEGGTRFQSAIMALREDGVCLEKDWPNHREGPPPGNVYALAKSQHRLDVKEAISQNPGQALTGDEADWVATNLSAVIVAELEAGRPLGLAFPIYPTGEVRNNWLDALLGDGTITFPDGVDPNDDTIGGHAVCAVGLRPDKKADGGGWVIFRNSIGSAFPKRPVSGMTGYGYIRMSLADTNKHCWDLFTLRPKDLPYQHDPKADVG